MKKQSLENAVEKVVNLLPEELRGRIKSIDLKWQQVDVGNADDGYSFEVFPVVHIELENRTGGVK
jgi:hypothetical protein